jgi:hypothetical protein
MRGLTQQKATAGDLNNSFYHDYNDASNQPALDHMRRGSLLPAASAAAALASLHNQRPEYEWESDPVWLSYTMLCSKLLLINYHPGCRI